MTDKKKTYRVTPDGGGFGGQYYCAMAGVAFCERKGYEYLHRPFSAMDHGEPVDKLNKFIGIPFAPPNVKADIVSEYFPKEVEDDPIAYFTPRVLDKIRGFYYSTPKPADCEYDIAIHIRRGDVVPWSHENRYTTNRAYKKIIKRLKAAFPNYSICIYSEGEMSDFKALAADNVHFYLNGDLEKAFHDMVTAKILVAAKSNFSYTAALLSVNTIYYISFWLKPLAHWRVIEEYPLAFRWAFAAGRRITPLKVMARKLRADKLW